MKFKENYFSKEKYFSVGVEEESGKYYVSIPVSNSKADYEEYGPSICRHNSVFGGGM